MSKNTNNTVILVRPPSSMGAAHAHALQHPMGLCLLAACLRDAGFTPEILDYEVNEYRAARFAERIRRARPLAVGITAMTPVIGHAFEMARIVKRERPEARALLGGAHASILPLRTLEECPCADAVCTGEGESKITALCRAAAHGEWDTLELPGAILRASDGTLRDFTAAPCEHLDLDALPMPARDLLDFGKYLGASTPGIPAGKYRSTQLFTSRGCPGKCIFCCSDRMFGSRVRFRGIEHIMREVRECMDRHGINHFTIDDDTFTLRRGRVMEFCGRMAALPATWDCDTRVDQVDRDMIRAMARSGCVKIAFGVESGSQRILDLIKKGVTVEQIRNAFAWTREAGAMSCAFLMVGSHPEETARDIRLTWKLIRDIKPDLISVMIATPYPGSELHELMRRENLLREVPWSAYAQSFEASSFSRTKTLSAAQLKFWQNRLLAGFYLRPGYIAGRLARMDSAADLEYWAHAGLGFLKHLAGK